MTGIWLLMQFQKIKPVHFGHVVNTSLLDMEIIFLGRSNSTKIGLTTLNRKLMVDVMSLFMDMMKVT